MIELAGRFANFDADEFLREYWQQKPLLIRNPWPQWANPLDPDELAGLACEPHVESRLITQDIDAYELEHGPLPLDRFGNLGKAPWTLLVQAVDHHVPAVSDLLEPFRFIPNWRVDDVMVSYAVTGGGVGAHFDQYDVFLVQGQGKRRWQLGGMCDDKTELLDHDGLRLLADFQAIEDWALEPGDILYVPPRLAHKGVALTDDCMTYSIGFRAPSRSELIEGFTAQLLDEINDDDRYGDPGLSQQSNPGQITEASLSQLHAMATERLSDKDAFTKWFAEYATEPKNAEIDWRPEQLISAQEVAEALTGGCELIRNPASRFAFVHGKGGSLLLAVDGQAIECADEAKPFAEALCAQPRIKAGPDYADLPSVRTLIEHLHNHGSIAVSHAEYD